MKTRITFIEEVSAMIDLPLKQDQLDALDEIYTFLFQGGPKSAFILKGYAGTGKTTLMGGLIRWFHSVNRKTVLLAPTGRSAKVLAAHSGYSASTIHRRIYTVKEEGGRSTVQLKVNTSEKTIFLVDEASMIGEDQGSDSFGSRSLLEDLVSYVYSGTRCRLLLIGDDAQLPPVGMDLSPALDVDKFASILRSSVYSSTLTEVARQQLDSLILDNATHLREQIRLGDFEKMELRVSREDDVSELSNFELEEKLNSLFYGSRSDNSVVICRSNKDANQFNQQIRARVLFREELLEAGDRLMIVKNNYHWEIPGKRQNFLANGDIVTVDRVFDRCEFGPFSFAEVTVHFSDEPDKSFDLILLLNTLDIDGPNLDGKELNKLRHEMIKAGALDGDEAQEKFFQNPYFRAVQVKYAYAITCHKSQGGQWSDVLIYQGYFTPEMMDRSYFRWLYTALTRATSNVYLINFHSELIVAS